jgi:hypothetical protein
MNKWGKNSKKHRESIDWHLNAVSDQVLKIRDHSIIEGHRPEAEQNAAFDSGASHLRWPDGKHNSIPSKALDMQPYPLPESTQVLREDLSYLAGLYVGIGRQMGLRIRWGGSWDETGETVNNKFDDLYHIEVVE